MAAANNAVNDGWKALLDHMVKMLMVFILAWAGWQQSQLAKLDERVYILQRDAVTEQKLAAMEQRLTAYTDIRMSDLSNKVDVTNKYLEMLLQSMTKEK